jgi:hypothetical protein
LGITIQAVNRLALLQAGNAVFEFYAPARIRKILVIADNVGGVDFGCLVSRPV